MSDRAELDDPSELLGTSLRRALEEITLPCYLLDSSGRIRWTNAASRLLIGDRVGELYTDLAPRDYRAFAQRQFARKVVSGDATNFDAVIVDEGGDAVEVRIHSVPLHRGDAIVGVFGIAVPLEVPRPPLHVADDQTLTPRQLEVLRLLARGLQTRDIAGQLGIAEETVRNHIRGLLRGLGAHSRLEAVAVARRRGVLDDGP